MSFVNKSITLEPPASFANMMVSAAIDSLAVWFATLLCSNLNGLLGHVACVTPNLLSQYIFDLPMIGTPYCIKNSYHNPFTSLDTIIIATTSDSNVEVYYTAVWRFAYQMIDALLRKIMTPMYGLL